MDDRHPAPWYDEVVVPVLLAAARTTYGRAIAAALDGAGFGDMPRTGSRLVGGIARRGRPLRDVAGDLGVSKQAASQLVDTLVLRGYVTRVPDPDDRRRVTVDLTERGRAAAVEIRGAVERIDAALLAAVGPDDVAAMRRATGALCAMSDPHFA
jgi:DNA-binding MarR family transcriptional regulator